MKEDMTPTEYIEAILQEQNLAPDGPELEQLRARRDEVRSVINGEYGTAPIVKEGGIEGEAHDDPSVL